MKAGPELAWRQLIKEKGHFAAALAGVAFAVTLMLSQIGLRDSLINTGIRLYQHMRADIVMTSWEYQFQQGYALVPRRRFTQALAVNGVVSCDPLQIGWLTIENPNNHQEHQIVMLGFDPNHDMWDFKVDFRKLVEPGSVIYDSNSRVVFGPLAQSFRDHGRTAITASRHHATIVDMVELGPGFGDHGHVFVSEGTYNTFTAGVGSPLPTVGLIRLKPGMDAETVRRNLAASLPDDVRFVLFQDFLDQEKDYWLKGSPIGFVFTAGLVLGIVVGSVVVYQILYSDVTSHLAEYATMKAMGYTNMKLFSLVILQALFISVIGFIPGSLMAEGIFIITHKATMLPLEMTVVRLAEVYAMTFTMCVGSAMIAMLALRSADPAEIF